MKKEGIHIEKYLPLILDFLVVLFLIRYVWESVRRGFIRIVLQMASLFIAMLSANALSSIAAEYAFENYVKERLTEKISEQIVSVGSTGNFLQILEEALENVPAYLLRALEFAGLPADFTLPPVSGSVEQWSRSLVERTIRPTCIALFSQVFFLLFFFLLLFLTRIIFRRFSAIRRIPIIGPVNSLLGGLVGALEGILYLYLAVTIADLVLTLTGDSIPYLNHQMLENTHILRLFLERNTLGSLLVPDFSGVIAIGQAFLQFLTGG